MRSKWLTAVLSLVVIATLLASCGPAGTPTEEPTEPPEPTEVPTEVPTEAPTEPPLPGEGFKVGQVTDMGGIDDQSFNQTAWEGMQQASEELGVEIDYLESQQPADYAPNITQFLEQDYNMLVTVGFLLAEDTYNFAQENPETYFAIVDFGYAPGQWEEDVEPLGNLVGLIFDTDEAAFLAGYLAAGMTETGVVGTFGGIPIPTVTIFMVGFQSGVEYYNAQHGTEVEVVGWDSENPDAGLFTFDFEDTELGRQMGETLIAEGADIILPVAGPVGVGTAAVLEEQGGMLIGVDADWCLTAADFCPIILTSVLKRMDVTVPAAIRRAVTGEWEAGTNIVGNLENEGVSLAPFHEFEDDVPDELKAELDELADEIIAGDRKSVV